MHVSGVRQLAAGFCLLSTIACVSASCSSSDSSGGSGDDAAAGGSGQAGGAAGAGGGSAANGGSSTGGKAGSAGTGIGQSGSAGSAGGPTCGGSTQKAKPIPFDMYVMMDKSGSMAQKTAQGVSKWAAVQQAFDAFVKDPASSGIGLGIQFFPKLVPGVPSSCTSDAACSAAGPCAYVKVCQGPAGDPKSCDSPSDCGGAACLPIGLCENDENATCAFDGTTACGGTLGACLKLPGYCAGRDSCQLSDYSAPAVEVGLLPGNGAAVLSAMGAQAPDGNTPTAPALTGAVQHAQAWATSNPGHTVIAVLATDGLPTECTPQTIPEIAAIADKAKAGTPSVQTFVIGVLGTADLAKGAAANLDLIASSGGSSKAFVIDATGDVGQQFLATLNVIRGAALSCEYAVPTPTMGTLEYDLVNVEYTPSSGSGAQTIYYVGDASKCDAATGGWFYDVEPAKGTPKKIQLCPATCKKVQSDPGARVDVRLGCKTVGPPPK